MKILIFLGLASSALAAIPCGVHLQWQPWGPGQPWQPNAMHGRYARSIIGGRNVTAPGKWPWQLYMKEDYGDGYENACGATVISNQWVLTAAHCITKGIANITTVTAGVNHRDDPTGTIYSVAEIIKHPGYIREFGEHDITLLKLDTPLVFNNLVSPICLPSATQFIANDARAVATGFGKTDKLETSKTDFQLREVMIPIVPQDDCQNRWSPRVEALEEWSKRKIICASSLAHGTGKGDSGGPLMMKASDGRWFQIGVTSFSAKGSDKTEIVNGEMYPNVFTDVRQYCQWIKENTKGEASCQEEEVVLEDAQILA